MEAEQDNQNKRLDDHSKRIKEQDDKIDALTVLVTVMQTKIGLAAVLGSLIGSGVMTFILSRAG